MIFRCFLSVIFCVAITKMKKYKSNNKTYTQDEHNVSINLYKKVIILFDKIFVKGANADNYYYYK